MIRWSKHRTFCIAIPGLLIFLASLFVPLNRDRFSKGSVQSVQVVDRVGTPLRDYLNDQHGRGQWRSLDRITSDFLEATIAVEDKRFTLHPGIDPLATVRALWENIRSFSFRSGGSTLTQQVIRNVYHYPRTPWLKAVEAWDALRLERMMSKKEILEQYVNRVPYGNQLYGVESAARWYFGKSAEELSLAEAAFLAALPNAPTHLNPYRNFPALCQRQQLVLRRMLEQKRIGEEEFRRAIEQPMRILPKESAFRAPHAVEFALRSIGEVVPPPVLETTIDYALQQDIQAAMRSRLSVLKRKNVTNAAVIVLENRTREIRVMIGSANYFDESTQGQVNGAVALRQPGSALKPFMYGVALESGYSTSTIIPDIPTQLNDDQGSYTPENYDRQFHGPVRLRTALACSYNIPAVRVLSTLGIDPFLNRLHEAGFESLRRPASFYGYGLVLGTGEVTLLELTNAYASLADGGIWKPPILVQPSRYSSKNQQPACGEATSAAGRQLFDDRILFLLRDILSDPAARRPAFGNAFRFPFACAVKTGTTKDFRDNWTVGFTTRYTVGVWAGNFDGSPMHGVSGVAGAGQIFFDIMMLLHMHHIPPGFDVPKGVEQIAICPLSGKLPGDACRKTILEWFRLGEEPRERCMVHRSYRVVDRGVEQTKMYEIVAPEFRSWALQERIQSLPSHAVPSRCAGSDCLVRREKTPLRPAIFYPVEGDQFKIDPVLRLEFQSIQVVGAVPEQADSVLLRVDEDSMVFNPHGTWWTLKLGKHVMQLEVLMETTRRLSNPVAFNVE